MTVMDDVVKDDGLEEAELVTEGERIRDEFPSHYEVIAVGQLEVDHRYQRQLTSLADQIAANPVKAMLGVLIVSRRANGRDFVVDGQTRLRGAERSGQIDELACLVYEGMTVANEAQLFAALQRNRRNIATHQRFNADLVAGDPMTKDIAAILKTFKLKVGPTRDRDLQAVAALEALWKRDHHVDEDGKVVRPSGPSVLQRTLGVLGDAWGDIESVRLRDIYSADMIRGVGRFVQGEGVDTDRLVKRLQTTTPSLLYIRANQARESKGGSGGMSIYLADVLLTEYGRKR